MKGTDKVDRKGVKKYVKFQQIVKFLFIFVHGAALLLSSPYYINMKKGDDRKGAAPCRMLKILNFYFIKNMMFL